MTNKMVRCNYCDATGKIPAGYGGCAATMCPVCLGRSQISIDSNARKCPGCNGTGWQYTGYHTVGLVKHSSCRGTGWITPANKQTAYLLASHNNMR